MKHLKMIAFFLVCIALGIALGLAIRRFAHKPTNFEMPPGPGLLPELRGFTVRAQEAAAPTAYATSFDAMKMARANAIAIVGDAADPRLDAIASAARTSKMRFWLIHAPATKADAAGYAAQIAAAATRAKALKAEGLGIGLGIDAGLGDDAYWRGVFKKARAAAPDAKLMFISDRENYPWIGFWDAVDVVGVTGEISLTPRRDAQNVELRGFARTFYEELTSFAGKIGQTAMLVDVTVPPTLTPQEREDHLEALLEESVDRIDLQGVFLKGWAIGKASPTDLNALTDMLSRAWRPKPPATKPADTLDAPSPTLPETEEATSTNTF